MNTATTEYLSVLREEGLTAEEAAQALAQDVVTAQDLPLPKLAAWLGSTGLGITLDAMSVNAAYPLQLRNGVKTVLQQLAWRAGPNEVLSTKTNPAVATQFDQVTNGLQQAGIITGDQRNEVLAMAGGYRYERLNSDAITAHWEAVDAQTQEREFRIREAAIHARLIALIDAGKDMENVFTEIEESIEEAES